jgi:hypothetical protein
MISCKGCMCRKCYLGCGGCPHSTFNDCAEDGIISKCTSRRRISILGRIKRWLHHITR